MRTWGSVTSEERAWKRIVSEVYRLSEARMGPEKLDRSGKRAAPLNERSEINVGSGVRGKGSGGAGGILIRSQY